MTIKVNGPGMPGEVPSAQEMRSHLLETIPASVLESVAAWLGLESVERSSDDIFDLTQSLVDSIELQKNLKAFEQLSASSSSEDKE